MAKKILIMEDKETLRDILKVKLVSNDYDVLTVEDGKAGMEVLQEYNPDLILLDMMMPNMDGFSVLEKMNEENLISRFPVIIISNSGQPVEVERALALGIRDYIIKIDFDPAEVLEKVRKIFENINSENNNSEIQKEYEQTQDFNEGISGDGGLEAEVMNMYKEEEDNDNGLKILLVEDDDFLRGICERKLLKEGFEVSVSADGADALEKIMSQDFELILLDVILPNMNGFEILEKVKQNPDKAKTTIIMLTNMGQESEIKRGLDLGADDYFIKAHFTVDDIIRKIKEVIIKKNIGKQE